MIANDVNNIILPIVLDSLAGLVPVLFMVGSAVVFLSVVLFTVYEVLKFVSPTFAGVVDEYWNGYRSDVRENFLGSPLGRAYSAYRERSGVHDGAELYIESRSLGPKEYIENKGSFSGYDFSDKMNIVPADNVDLED